MEGQLVQIALVAALAATMIFPVIFELDNVPDLVVRYVILGLVMVATLFMLMSVVHSVFYIIIMNEYNSMDEFMCWIELIGWKATFPMQMFMIGMFTAIVAICVFIFGTSDFMISISIVATLVIIYCICHVVLASVLGPLPSSV